MFHMSKMKAAVEKVADLSELCKTCTLNCFHVTFWQQQHLTRHNQTSCFNLLFIAHDSRGLQQCQSLSGLLKNAISTQKLAWLYYSRMQEWDKCIFSYKNDRMPVIQFVCSSVCCVVLTTLSQYEHCFAHPRFAKSQLAFHVMYRLAWNTGFL